MFSYFILAIKVVLNILQLNWNLDAIVWLVDLTHLLHKTLYSESKWNSNRNKSWCVWLEIFLFNFFKKVSIWREWYAANYFICTRWSNEKMSSLFMAPSRFWKKKTARMSIQISRETIFLVKLYNTEWSRKTKFRHS